MENTWERVQCISNKSDFNYHFIEHACDARFTLDFAGLGRMVSLKGCGVCKNHVSHKGTGFSVFKVAFLGKCLDLYKTA